MINGYDKNFTFDELTNSTSFPELVKNNRKDAMQFVNSGKRLSKLLGSIRSIWNKPIKATSGFRNGTLNIAVGSKAKNSTHQKFEASDLLPPKGMTLNELFDGIMEAFKDGLLPDLRKVIREDHRGICHVEVKMDASEETSFYTTKDNIKFKRKT